MQAADIVALYGAGLATALAAGQATVGWRSRRRLRVSAALTYGSRGDYGTPVRVQRGKDLLDERVHVGITVRNIGGKAVQVVAVVIEAVNADRTSATVHQVSPEGTLPVVLDAGSSVVVAIEKEHLDMTERPTFVGVVDGTGRRHGIPTTEAKQLIEQAWGLPTRVALYYRRDDPAERVVAMQLQDPAMLIQRPVTERRFRKGVEPIASRARPLMDILQDGEQPRASGS